ncbi:hypothetical protein [Ideonella sp. YS5]|uniref:hypothetical protein n=1 Tax=Ideonella sp. YS5 TaxID=3453714 RepID=UPI003EED6F24
MSKALAALATMVFACGLVAQAARAADGDLDPSFGRGGLKMTDFHGGADLAHAVAVQPDGKIVVAGTTYQNNDYSHEDFAIARYTADGRLDDSFGTKGRVTTDFPGLAATPSSVVVQPDGKILVAGGAYPLFVFAGNFEIARYNADGTLDAGFGNGGIVTTNFGHGSYAFGLALQPDGKIVAAGTVFVDFSTDDSSNTDFGLARYNADGSPDSSFGNGGQVLTDFDGFNDDALAVLIQPDGKIVAAGSAKNPTRYYDFALARYLPDGSLDSSFGQGGKVRTDFGVQNFDQARAAVLQPDGRIVAAGFASLAFGDTRYAAARYNADGTLDKSFGSKGKTRLHFGSCCERANSVLLQPDGKVVLVGFPDSESSDSDFVLARLDTSGALDASFGKNGRVRTSFGQLNGGANGAAMQPDGKIVAVGFQATSSDKTVEFAIARYVAAGAD